MANLIKVISAEKINEVEKAVFENIIVTHHGVFHADEATASALIIDAFGGDTLIVRTPHQADVESVLEEAKKATVVSDPEIFIVDIGRIYDEEKRRFDHHQWGRGDDQFGRSSAGLIFDYLKFRCRLDNFEVEELAGFVQMVDENDIGVYEGPWEGTLPWVVSLHNAKDIYSSLQNERFAESVEMVVKIIKDAKASAASKRKTFEVLKDAEKVFPGVVEMPAYLPGWQDMIFSIPELDQVDLVIWYDDIQDTWKIQQVPDAKGSFGRRGRKVRWSDPLPKGATFIHKGEFFGVFKTKEDLLEYIKTL